MLNNNSWLVTLCYLLPTPLSTPEAYAYISDLLQLDEQCPRTPSPLIHGILSIIKAPLQWQEWDKSPLHHPDQQFRSYIVNGIRYGFKVGFNYSQTCRRSKKNLPSCREQPQVINDYLAVECAEGRVLGPLEPNNLPYIHTSHIGVIPKSTPGKWRLITDMSFPEGSSVNDGISEKFCSLSYVGVQDAIQGILTYGKGALLAKVDIRNAYRVVPIHPDDWWLMGMYWLD